MLYLKKLNSIDSYEEYMFFKKMAIDVSYENDYKDISYEDFKNKAIPKRLEASDGISLEEGYVPDTYYFLWKDEQIIGLFRIRHYLNEFLRNGPGHIGYGILPEFRNHGYATKGLALAIEKCKEIIPSNEKEIYMSCNLDNYASLCVMKKNDAYIHHIDENGYHTRIKV